MIITLYKNCRLNKSYCEVLDTISQHIYNGVRYANCLEAYLSTLPKKVFNTGAGTIYGTNSGKIPFELAQGEGLTMYDYNYMKIADETNNFVRYCFILSLQVADGSAIAEYEEDVWASYSASMHVRKSLLIRSRTINYENFTIPFYKPSMEYEGNNGIKYESIHIMSPHNNEYGYIKSVVAQMQFYQLGTYPGEKTKVFCKTVSFFNRRNNTLKIEDIIDTLTDIILGQSNKKFVFGNTYKTRHNIPSGDWYYEISNIVLIPEKIGIYALTEVEQDSIGQVEGINEYFADLAENLQFHEEDTYFKKYGYLGEIKNFKILDFHTAQKENMFKLIGIGTPTNIYNVENNGSEIVVRLLAECDDFNFNMYLNFQNQLINITDNYRLDVPISVQSADATQQAKTSRQLEIMNSVFQLGKGILGVYSGSNSIASGAGTEALGTMQGSLSTFISGSQTIASGVKELYNGMTNVAGGIANLVVLNKPLYRTNKGTFSLSNGIINAYFGLLMFLIDADNETEVQANIDNAGYIVNEIVDDLLQDFKESINRPSYNVMQFGFVNIYGAFPENIRQRLVDILTNGFKIWYNTAEYIAS